jgi:acylphosphatase
MVEYAGCWIGAWLSLARALGSGPRGRRFKSSRPDHLTPRHPLSIATRFIVTGRVQGVGYRFFTCREAQALGICGHVRNLPDGSVEVVAQGEPDVLQAFAERLKEGPPFGRVEGMERSAVPAVDGRGFTIL